jgi:glutamyl-tRNA synthetase
MTDHDSRGPVRVRFAPSPTGFLHVGGARTAIYNDLLRQRLGGAFVLRIEDTDKARSDEAMTRQIQSALAWIGVEWDEGPFLQSAREQRHVERAQELLAAGKAYRCFCTTDFLDEQRRLAEKQGQAFRYPRTCLSLSAAAVAQRTAAGESSAVRFRMPEAPIRFHDLVRGDVEFSPEVLDDFILLRSDGSPTYHMSVVCDDIDMAITHVIRGEDHLTNTGKHVPLFAAFGAPVPTFGHLPLILGADRKRLSKRFGATSVEEFRTQGILPQALYNYLALLGWSPGEDRELMTRGEMAAIFTTTRFNSSPAVFDAEKLAWVNAHYLVQLPVEEILEHAAPFLEEAGLAAVDRARLRAAVLLHRSRARTLREVAAAVRPYFVDVTYDATVGAKFVADRALPELLRALAARFAAMETWTKEDSEAALRGLASERALKAGALIHPTRMALSGEAGGPPLFDLVALMGRERCARHFANFEAFLTSPRQDVES